LGKKNSCLKEVLGQGFSLQQDLDELISSNGLNRPELLIVEFRYCQNPHSFQYSVLSNLIDGRQNRFINEIPEQNSQFQLMRDIY
jgi:hypothetical protein